ncbi:GrdX protein [Propionigenium maris DSM 9537]|uniref:GrdX protein n=1 Tax=Propionigenium maris DSM 9537 TaxID=1123000 RepID=A0A9W6GQ54_9FUSO|nr:GrdX protein [Propionigenium maris DSM 9537]
MEVEYLIVTNNPLVKEGFDDIYFVEGTSRELLEKVRDLVHAGHELVTHPLGASLRMMFSPCFSVVLRSEKKDLNYFHTEIIESSLEKYKLNMEVRGEDTKNSRDYAMIDYSLLRSAFVEIGNNQMSF